MFLVPPRSRGRVADPSAQVSKSAPATTIAPVTQPEAAEAAGELIAALAPVGAADQAASPTRERQFVRPKQTSGVTVLIPAYNEANFISETLRSVLAQTLQPDEVIVVDDLSNDGTGEVARRFGVTVVRPERNSGSKAGALNHGLTFVKTPYTLAIDADTILEHDAIERLVDAVDTGDPHYDRRLAGVCGYVIPRNVRTMWERGRYIEYLFAFTIYKPIQDYYERPLIASGCFSMYRTDILRTLGGWPSRTLAEDMDLTWKCYEAGYRIRFVQEAVCYPVEPHNYAFMRKQLRRWTRGFFQCVRVHWQDLLKVPYLRTIVAVAMWDATVATLAFFVMLPLLAIFISPLFLLGYFIDLPAVLVPVLFKAAQRGEVLKALASIPGFYVLRVVNGVFVLSAFWNEIILGRTLHTFEKGH
jgi:cellulose synthase/poly-beta-1,6-N-acetylglucosamine synthase-like glycosyltransferase